MARQMHHHDQLRGYGGGDCRQGDWIVEVVHRPSTQTDDPLMEWKLCGDKNVCPLGRIVPDCSHMDFPVSLRAIQAMLAFTIVIIARVLSMEWVGACSFHWKAGAALACFPAWLTSGAVNVKADVLAGVSSWPLIKSDV